MLRQFKPLKTITRISQNVFGWGVYYSKFQEQNQAMLIFSPQIGMQCQALTYGLSHYTVLGGVGGGGGGGDNHSVMFLAQHIEWA